MKVSQASLAQLSLWVSLLRHPHAHTHIYIHTCLIQSALGLSRGQKPGTKVEGEYPVLRVPLPGAAPQLCSQQSLFLMCTEPSSNQSAPPLQDRRGRRKAAGSLMPTHSCPAPLAAGTLPGPSPARLLPPH